MSEWQTRKSLIIRACDPHDQNAWNDFYRYYKDFICMILNKMNIHSHDYEDLVQEILVQLWNNLKKYDDSKGKFRTWLSTVIKNKVMSFLNSKTRRENRELKSTEIINIHNNDIENIIEEEWKSYLTSLALERVKTVFSGKAVEVFNMSMLEYSNEQISEKLDISIDSVYTLKNRVKSRYVKELKVLMEDLQF